MSREKKTKSYARPYQSGTVGERLRSWGIERYGSVGEFAKALGIVSEGLSPYLTGKRNLGGIMQERLRALGCDIEWLMTGKPQSDSLTTEDSLPSRQGMVPLLGRIAAKPDGKLYFEDAPLDTAIPYFPGPFFALLVENVSLINAPEGDHSMEIYPGDICIFQIGKQPKNGDIVAVELKQSRGRMVKILKHKSKEEVELHSANKFLNYPAVTVKKSEIASFGVLVSKIKPSKGELRRLGM